MKALKIRQTALGLDHPSTAQTLSNLANLFHIQCKYDQAEPLYKTLLEIRTRLGRHMHVAEVLNSLAEVYQDQGRYAEAEQHFWRHFQSFKKTSVQSMQA
ncbi:MAG: tetratricopeptide repeat protein [Candidatus Melainabacteria bacterium]|nr:MAG: tetratricopeptide repeat protein [Candidatus Melainabacteria bacterium]